MKKPPVVFIAKKEYYNIGIGYMAAVLKESGFETETLDLDDGNEKILKKILILNPLIIGFSVIYQYYINRFIKLAGFLRQRGITCHFTAGGHYASLKYEELLLLIPCLDSVVRFEGEYTMCELVKHIYKGKDFIKINSIAYKKEGKIVSNPLRPLERDLDRFPFPLRESLSEYALGKKFATIMAGRGCAYNCSFCNLGEFYRPFRGPRKRVRNPEMVAREMEYLFREKDCSVFLFQDDDFPVRCNNNSDWLDSFCEELELKGLCDKIMWKINCRPDEVDEYHFQMMKKNGLFLVFTGIEDGTDSGLERINKHLTVAKSLEGINILKKLEIGFDFGFMLFKPDTNFASLRLNLGFLRKVCGDGSSTLPFLKMMPYYETRLEKELLAEGRIKGKPGNHDYDFPDVSMNRYFEFLSDCFTEWTQYRDGVANISKWARNFVATGIRYFKDLPLLHETSDELKQIISESNLFFLDTMEELATVFEDGKDDICNPNVLKTLRKHIGIKHRHFKQLINNNMTRLSLLAGLLSNTKRHFIDIDSIKPV